MGYIDGPNEYVLAMNNPLLWIDPYGLWKRGLLNYTSDSAEQLVYGNYTDKVTVLGTALQVASGFIGVDIVGDVRDITHDIKNWECSWSHAGKTALDAVGLFPIVGSLKYADEAGTLIKSAVKNADEIANPLPKTIARVIPTNISTNMLGKSNAKDVFVTAADDIKGLDTKGIANRLGIPPNNEGFKIIEFDTPAGIASPVNRSNVGFVGGGRTSGGAREFVIPNTEIPEKAKIRIVE